MLLGAAILLVLGNVDRFWVLGIQPEIAWTIVFHYEASIGFAILTSYVIHYFIEHGPRPILHTEVRDSAWRAGRRDQPCLLPDGDRYVCM